MACMNVPVPAEVCSLCLHAACCMPLVQQLTAPLSCAWPAGGMHGHAVADGCVPGHCAWLPGQAADRQGAGHARL